MKILLACYGGAHIRTMVPLRPWLDRAGYESTLLALTAAAPVAERLGIPHKRITDFVNADDPEIMRAAAPLLRKHHNPNIGISERESIAYLGGSMRALIETLGEQQAWERYHQEGLAAFDALPLPRSIIAAAEPDIVVATCSPRLESALLRAASAQGILSICVVALFPTIGMTHLKLSDNGEFIVVGNQRFKEQLIDQGRSESSIIVSGNPAFDLLAVRDKEARRRTLRKKRNIADDQIVVLWAEQPDLNPEWPIGVRNELVSIAQDGAHLVPIIRLHPASQEPFREELPAGVQLSTRDEDATDALLTADIVVTGTSTLGYEAALMGLEVVVVRGSGYDAAADYSERDGVYVIENVSHLRQALQDLTQDRNAKQRLAACRATLPKPGTFAQNLVEVIGRLARAGGVQTH